MLNPKPITAPAHCAITKSGTDEILIPGKVSVKLLAKVTAGLAKDVEEVKR